MTEETFYEVPGKVQRPHRRRRKKRFPTALILILLAVLLCGAMLLCVRLVQSFAVEEAMAQEDPWPGVAPYTIAVDAGHGGKDSGAVYGYLTEADINITVAKALEQWLENDPNYTPVLTHNYDAFAIPAERRETAQTANAVLLFSMHCNANVDSPGLCGYEVYTENKNKPYAAESLRLANDVADALSAAGHSPQGSRIFYCHYEGDDEKGYTKYTVSEEKESVFALTGQSFGVLESNEMPAVLVELGYITNSRDTSYWLQQDGNLAAARAYYEAICTFFGTVPLAA